MDKVSNIDLKRELLSILSPELEKFGFSFKSQNCRFFKSHDGITDRFQLVWLDGKPGYRVQPNVGVRVERVENIFHQTSGFESKYKNGTASMGNAIGQLLTGDARSCEFLLEFESEIPQVAKKIINVFHEYALSYFERWGSLDTIDAELNDNPAEGTLHRLPGWLRCSTGIIVARLVGRSDYDQLVSFYTDVMTQNSKGFYLKRFQALLESLELVEAGSRLREE